MISDKLWTEKYRPNTLDGYVFKDESLKDIINKWIREKSIPHILLSGVQGSGKTTLAKILTNELNVIEYDIMFANGSKEGRKIDWVDKLISFCQTMPFGDFKVIIIDEADYLGAAVQPALRNLMESYSSNVRFILTCNYPNRIIPALHSRCQQIHIEKLDITEFTARIATILISENIEFDLDVLDTFVQASYPDLRKCINNTQMNTIDGKLQLPDTSNSNSQDYQIAMVDLFKQGKIREARKLLCNQARAEDMDYIYRWCYDNIDLFGDTIEKQEKAILIIKQGLVDHTICADAEINLSATLIRLANNM